MKCKGRNPCISGIRMPERVIEILDNQMPALINYFRCCERKVKVTLVGNNFFILNNYYTLIVRYVCFSCLPIISQIKELAVPHF